MNVEAKFISRDDMIEMARKLRESGMSLDRLVERFESDMICFQYSGKPPCRTTIYGWIKDIELDPSAKNTSAKRSGEKRRLEYKYPELPPMIKELRYTEDGGSNLKWDDVRDEIYRRGFTNGKGNKISVTQLGRVDERRRNKESASTSVL